jgi:predicted ATPase
MSATFFQKIRLDGFLSFAPGSDALELRPLNVLIGVNASGKSNLIEAFELQRAMPTNPVDAIREGGGAAEWIWKGEGATRSAEIEVEVKLRAGMRPLRHRLAFTAVSHASRYQTKRSRSSSPLKAKCPSFTDSGRGIRSSWHPGQMKVWCSQPRIRAVSSGTTSVRINSAPHVVQRIACTPTTGPKTP